MMDPCIPRAWPGFGITFRYRSARYAITVENPRGVSRGVGSVEVDDVRVDGTTGIPSPMTAAPIACGSSWADAPRATAA